MVGSQMNNEFEIWKVAVVIYSRHYQDIYVHGGNGEIHEAPQASRCPGRDMNRAYSEYERV
jgi:hypothetical protein